MRTRVLTAASSMVQKGEGLGRGLIPQIERCQDRVADEPDSGRRPVGQFVNADATAGWITYVWRDEIGSDAGRNYKH
ncbi:MAG: hypothetical protein M3T56_09395 [Chloroflexota bacterium]|nr:hypothetical protein [Chloroflexota bacterium]